MLDSNVHFPQLYAEVCRWEPFIPALGKAPTIWNTPKPISSHLELRSLRFMNAQKQFPLIICPVVLHPHHILFISICTYTSSKNVKVYPVTCQASILKLLIFRLVCSKAEGRTLKWWALWMVLKILEFIPNHSKVESKSWLILGELWSIMCGETDYLPSLWTGQGGGGVWDVSSSPLVGKAFWKWRSAGHYLVGDWGQVTHHSIVGWFQTQLPIRIVF